MDTSPNPALRPVLLAAVRDLVATARRERATMTPHSPEHDFYRGVEAAADEVLHPELAMTRRDMYFDNEPPTFRDGYLETSSLLAHAAGSSNPRVPVPSPEARYTR